MNRQVMGTLSKGPRMYDHYKALKLEKRGRVMVVTLDNPPMNFMYARMHTELSQVFHALNADPEVAVVVLTGAGDKAFCAGGDIANMLRRIEEADHADWARTCREAREILRSLLNFEKPLISRINGHAMGLGANLAVMADFSYMIDSAYIADTHVKVGLSAGDGGSLMWPMLIGFNKAKQYLLTGDSMTGREAAALDLITAAAASIEELDELVYGMAERLEQGATLAINATKASINLLLRRLFEGVIEAHLGAETFTYLSEDHRSAAKAFCNKETPVFRGK